MELQQLEKTTEKQDIWEKPADAQLLMQRITELKDEIEDWEVIQKRCEDGLYLSNENDESFREELEKEAKTIGETIKSLELNVYLSGRYDKGNALLTINAGAGGTDSQDWAEMLQRMYLRWIEKRGYKSEIIDFSPGEEAGLKSTTILVIGKYAFGYLRAEKGVHRLVRLSPFDAAHRRHTSFTQVEVLPEIAVEDAEIHMQPEDLIVEVFKSSGAGGQNVQKNATAIRITHKPSGLVVTCQNERSQSQNRENALKVLRGRLYEISQQEKEKQIAALRGEYQKIEWGSQIRSYVLHPYQMVKDHRTDYETGNTTRVLDGDIDDFILAYLEKDRKL